MIICLFRRKQRGDSRQYEKSYYCNYYWFGSDIEIFKEDNNTYAKIKDLDIE